MQQVTSSTADQVFDPVKGCQIASTGLLGGLFIILLAAAYAVFQTNVLPGGGPRVAEIFTWFPQAFPETLHFRNVNRNFYDIPWFVFLGFVFMVNWEFQRTRRARIYTLLLAAVTVWAGWQVAWGASWFFAGDAADFLGWTWTRMEAVYGYAILGYAIPWIIYVLHPKTKLVTSPVGWALRSAFFRWLAGLTVFTLVLFIAFRHPFYLNNYYENWRLTCGYLYSIYFLFGLPYAFITNLLRGHKFEDRSDPNFVFMLLFRHGLRRFVHRRHRIHWRISNKRIGIVLRDILVKVFFIPLMVTFLFIESNGFFANLLPLWNALVDQAHWRQVFNFFYGSYFHGLFVIDVSLGLIGYASSSRWLNNKSKSVDPTLFGWFITLACYPPFNGVTAGYFPYNGMGGGEVFAVFQSPWMDVALKTVTLICFTIYVWATTAFGLRFSNLTNRGILTRGPYAFVRHPAYTMKNIAWWTENIRNFHSPWQFVFMAVWNYIYYLRAMTEERHLRRDPDYLAYCQRVKYRFIPGIW